MKYMEFFDWYSNFEKQSDSRYQTFREALKMLASRKGKLIVETGTVREEDDWGAGMSTFIFGKYCSLTGTRLYTVDNNPRNMFFSRVITEEFKDSIEYVISDSVEFLKNFREKIDLLYLDSLDYHYGIITDYYGGRENLELAIEKSNDATEEEILDRFGYMIEPCQEHQLNEIKMAYDKLSDSAVVLLDDALLPAQGKVRLSRRFLLEEGWNEWEGSTQQLLFTR